MTGKACEPAAERGEARREPRSGARRIHLLPAPERRGLSRVEAAEYVGISPSLFDELVSDGRMPGPKRINARTVWDRIRLDEAFASLPDDGDLPPRNPWDRES